MEILLPDLHLDAASNAYPLHFNWSKIKMKHLQDACSACNAANLLALLCIKGGSLGGRHMVHVFLSHLRRARMFER